MGLMKRLFRALFLLLMLPVLCWLFGFGLFVTQVMKNPPALLWQTDAVVVLTGGGERVKEGVRLLKSGVAKSLFISGVGPGVTVMDILRMNGNAADLTNGDLAARIQLGRAAANTQGNAEETRNWVKRHDIESIRLVTANYHMPRSRIEFHLMMPGLTIVPHPVEPPSFQMFRANGMPDKAGWQLMLLEYHKLLAIFLRQLGFYII